MIIRSAQMEVFESTAEDDFVRRLGEHLLEDYAETPVRLPEQEEATTVEKLPEDVLHRLIRSGIARARKYGLTFESSISAYTAVMFEAAPNFDRHNMSQLCLRDEEVDPNERLDEILKLLNETNWEKIRADYDPDAWEMPEAGEEEEMESDSPDLAATNINAEPAPTESAKSADLDRTVMTAPPPEKAAKPVNLDDINFDETMVGVENKPKEPVSLDDINFDETMIDVKKKDPKDIDPDATILNFDPSKE